ncbi:MAG: alginate O-acetyltransferase AlgX-related protein [Chthoniobacterales bacterium]
MRALNLQSLTERTLVSALLLAWIGPLILTGVRNLPRSHKLGRFLDSALIGRVNLTGVTESHPDVPLSWNSIMTAEFQKEKAREFDEQVSGRELMIRATDELWFRLFHDTASSRSTIAVGKHDVLFENTYLQEYFVARNTKAVLEPWIKQLRQLQDYCRSIGMGFAVVIAPSKVAVYPEAVPENWRRRADPRPRGPAVVADLLRENEIDWIDGNELMQREKRKSPPAPLFPKGGAHWSRRGVFIAANEIQKRFSQQGKPAEQIQAVGDWVVDTPSGDEADLVNVMNLLFNWKYPCERITIAPSNRPAEKRMTLAAVGDSFSWSLLRVLNESAQFSDIAFYYYYPQNKTRSGSGPSNVPGRLRIYPTEQFETVRTPAAPLDFAAEIFSADCLLLEITEAGVVSPEHHLARFLRDALAHLPNPAGPRPTFRPD